MILLYLWDDCQLWSQIVESDFCYVDAIQFDFSTDSLQYAE